MNGTKNRLVPIDKDDELVRDDTLGVPTCYMLVTIRGFENGTTKTLCAIPGVTP